MSVAQGQAPLPADTPDQAATEAKGSGTGNATAETVTTAELLERIRALEAKLADVQAGAPQQATVEADAALLPPDVSGLIEEVEPDLLKIYGFFDTGVQYLHYPDPRAYIAGFARTNGLTFQYGGMNLYFDAQPHEQFRALLETRLSLWPNGNDTNFGLPGDPSGYARTDTTVYDSSNTTGRNKIQWSGIQLERAWAQWQPRDWFNLRTGLFLTPYGIWNVDHGMPTLISLVLPGFFAAEFFPTRQIGVEAFGVLTKGFWDLGYHLTASNGRMIALTDVDSNKAFGGRVFARYKNRITLGGSWYWDEFKDIGKMIKTFVPFNVENFTIYKGKEYALAADLSADMGHFRLRVEGVMNRIQYDDGYHKAAPHGPSSRAANEYKYNAYVLLAYTRMDLHIEPYVMAEIVRQVNQSVDADATLHGSVGLNVLITPRVSVKNQFSAFKFANLENMTLSEKDSFYQIVSRLVLAF